MQVVAICTVLIFFNGLSWVIQLMAPTSLNPVLNILYSPSCPYESDPQLKTWPHWLIAKEWSEPHEALVIEYCDKLSTFSVTYKKEQLSKIKSATHSKTKLNLTW
jgi:hypothetical protein